VSKKILLFDFGGVVIKTAFELRDHAAKTLGPLPWAGPFDPASDTEWRRFQAGEITERQYWHDRAAGFGVEVRTFMDNFYEPPRDELLRSEIVALIREYQCNGGTVGCLTNDMQAFQNQSWIAAMDIIHEFDVVVDGSITGFAKPDLRAYEAALNALGDPDPASVVFIDDLPVNVAGADRAGMIGVHFDPTDASGSLDRILAALAS
jgi:putative hydrolase of the HAD superfamily